MPARLIAPAQDFNDHGRCQLHSFDNGVAPNCQNIFGMRPLQEKGPFDRKGLTPMRDHGTIRQIIDAGFMPGQALRMECRIKLRNPALPKEGFGFPPAAEKTWPVASGQCRDFIHEKQRRVTLAHGLMVLPLPVKLAADPVGAGPAPLAKGLVGAVELAAAVAHHQPARLHGDNLTVWLDAVLQGHGRQPEW